MEPLKDSASYIAQLERKLERIKKKNESSKVTGKDLIASMAEYKEIYMRNAFKNNIDLNTDYSNQIIDTSYLQRRITPVQEINVEETKGLIENDWLSNSRENKNENDSIVEITPLKQ